MYDESLNEPAEKKDGYYYLCKVMSLSNHRNLTKTI